MWMTEVDLEVLYQAYSCGCRGLYMDHVAHLSQFRNGCKGSTVHLVSRAKVDVELTQGVIPTLIMDSIQKNNEFSHIGPTRN